MGKRQSASGSLSLILRRTLDVTPPTDLPNQVEAFLKDAQEVVREATGGALTLRPQPFPSGIGWAQSVRIAAGEGHEAVLFRVFVGSLGIRVEFGRADQEFTTIDELRGWWRAQLESPESHVIQLMRAMRDHYSAEPTTT